MTARHGSRICASPAPSGDAARCRVASGAALVTTLALADHRRYPLLTGALVAAPWLDFSLFPLAWVAFVPLLWALGRAHHRAARRCARLLAGLATNMPAFYWLVYTIHVFGGFPYALAVFFYTCLSLFSAMQFVLFARGFRRLGFGPLGLCAPVLWVALEFLFPNLFPWRMANSQIRCRC